MKTRTNQTSNKKPTPTDNPLARPLRFVKGVGEKVAMMLARKDLFEVRDLLYYFPRTYEDRRKIYKISELGGVAVGQKVSVIGKIRTSHPVFFSKSKRRAFEMVLVGETGSGLQSLALTWFHGKPYFASKISEGMIVLARGELTQFRGRMQIVHPDIEVLGKNMPEAEIEGGIVPIYSETEGLYQKTIRKIVSGAVESFASFLEESLPAVLMEKHGFPGLRESVRALHFPKALDDLDPFMKGQTKFHERFIYEEFLEVSLSMAMRRATFVEESGVAYTKPERLWERLKENLPFKFTNAQRRVLQEILDDMTKATVMHRLVQGDVGSGKTILAAAAALVALENGYQVALMAPTEILIEQHRRNFERWFAGMNIPATLLTGSLKAKEKAQALSEIASAGPRIVFGTHALFEPEVNFSKLGLVIVDEQHRFGVRQRTALIDKGRTHKPDVLVMTATPIPRTLALTIYGDLDISIIDELPPGRKPIQTKVFVERERSTMEQKILEQIRAGRQAYIVYPLIEESEVLELKSIGEMMPHLESVFGESKIAHLHGKMKAEEKQKILDDFRANKIQILVSTTVVEVGVDVPNATVMVIENAERFGLSQLHQLRGRVGRGAESSFCYLVASHLGTEEIVKRLRSMEKTQDGFKLAELDLEMRGPGEFLGTKQSGLPQFQLAQLPRDLPILQRARKDALEWVAKDPELKEMPQMRARLQTRADRVAMN